MPNILPLPIVQHVLRTPEGRFSHLVDFSYTPHYIEIGGLRIAYIDEGPRDAPVVLLMHGEPTWSYLYRKMIPVLLKADLRVVAPDLPGFGRSDKPAQISDYTYLNQVAWMTHWLDALHLNGITMFCQDWGSLIGLRMVAERPEQFAAIALANGGLPTGLDPVPKAFKWWRRFARWSPVFPIGRIVASGCAQPLLGSAVAAYDAPFPERRYKAGARAFPSLVPTDPGNPARGANEAAWRLFEHWEKPFITLFSTRDPITRGGEKIWQKRVPGARGQTHTQVRGAGHFLQEDKGEEVAQLLIEFMRHNAGSIHKL